MSITMMMITMMSMMKEKNKKNKNIAMMIGDDAEGSKHLCHGCIYPWEPGPAIHPRLKMLS
jgi:hypothetical protein